MVEVPPLLVEALRCIFGPAFAARGSNVVPLYEIALAWDCVKVLSVVERRFDLKNEVGLDMMFETKQSRRERAPVNSRIRMRAEGEVLYQKSLLSSDVLV